MRSVRTSRPRSRNFLMKISRKLKIAVVLLLIFAVWILFAPYLAENLIIEKPLERADAILVLGGSSVFMERTQKAAEVFKNGAAPQIILTDDGEKAGWSKIEKRNPPYVELARKNLILNGVPFEAIEIIKPDGSGTIYEAQILREKAGENNWKTILLVTSAYHTRRTLRTFEKVCENEKTKNIYD